MRQFKVLLLLIAISCSMFAQDRLSLFIGRANKYASVELSDYRKRVLIEIGIRPGSVYYNPFYDRVNYHSNCWHEHYCSYCDHHRKHHHKHYKKHKKHKHNKHYRWDDDDDDDWDDD